MTIAYNLNIPNGPNNPSSDQPLMQTNTNSISTLIAVDHVTFSGNPAGTHKQVTLSSKNPAGPQSDPQSTVFSNSGVASSVAQLFFRNANATFPLSGIAAFGSFTIAAVPVLVNSYNVVSVSQAAGVYRATLTSNCVTGTSICLIVSISGSQFSPTWTFTNSGSPIVAFTPALGATGTINFVAFQA